MTDRIVEHVTCLGCGCGCDDVSVTVQDDRIVAAAPLCPLGQAWLGNGRIPSEVLVEGRAERLESAISRAAAVLIGGGPVLVYLAPELTSQAQRAALAVADLLGASVDTATSETAAHGLLSAQRRGRTSATLGELRNRADTYLFWGVDPTERYPRFLARYALDPEGRHVPQGRRGRQVISVSIGSDRGLPGADLELTLSPEHEIAALSLMRAVVLGVELSQQDPIAQMAVDLAGRLARARYAVLVHDAEATAEPRNPLRAEALLALAEALNEPTRAALCSLRAGGNRVGAEAVLTSQTGYPLAVDYSRGYPRYSLAERPVTRLRNGGFRAALVAGSISADQTTAGALSAVSTVLVGPRASQSELKSVVTIDTGVAGIHEGGTAYRMDEVPLRLRPPLETSQPTHQVLGLLAYAIRDARRKGSA